MKKDYFARRHWAETIRLYSGLLESPEREVFIKSLASKNVLLAAECSATSFYPNDVLEDYISKIALSQAIKFKKSQESASSLMALAELNKVDEIISIFSETSQGGNRQIHFDVVSNIMINGTELQIVTFLIILSKSNHQLLNTALDHAIELNFFFAGESIEKGREMYEYLLENNKPLLAIKAASVFQIKTENSRFDEYIYLLLENYAIRTADKFVSINNQRPSNKILSVLSTFVSSNAPINAIILLVNFLKRHILNIDINSIRLQLAKHLNPRVKEYAINWEKDHPISKDLARQICYENIALGSKSSIEFALHIIDQFHLENEISISTLVENLLRESKYQKLELAYRLINQYELTGIFSYRLILNLLIGLTNNESLSLARQIVKTHSKKWELNESLSRIACISLEENNHNKLAKEIFFKDLIPSQANKSQKRIEYYGLVSNYYKGYYSIHFDSNSYPVLVPRALAKNIRVNNFITFRFIEIKSKISESVIQILNNNVMNFLHSKFYYNSLFIGKIVELKIDLVQHKVAILSSYKYSRLKFVLPIGEIKHEYIAKIHEEVSAGQHLKVQVKNFDPLRRTVYVSLKDISIPVINKIDVLTEDFKSKISLLKERFSSK